MTAFDHRGLLAVTGHSGLLAVTDHLGLLGVVSVRCD